MIKPWYFDGICTKVRVCKDWWRWKTEVIVIQDDDSDGIIVDDKLIFLVACGGIMDNGLVFVK